MGACLLALSAVLLCTASTGVAVTIIEQQIADCEYGDNITDMVYFVKNVINKEIETLYDSRVGKYVGFGEDGIRNADHYNSQLWKMVQRKTEVDTTCRYHARLFRRSTLDRKGAAVRIVHQQIADCVYGGNSTDMVYVVRNIFNKRIESVYDSRVGKYTGFGEDGIRNAKYYNSLVWKRVVRRAEVETLCRYNARLFRRSTLDRKVAPTVTVRQTKPSEFGQRTMLECNVMGFYPQEARVSWLKDGVEVLDEVSATDILPNEDWSFQLHSYLELTLQKEERVTCRVEHSSLSGSLEVDFDTFPLEAKFVKLVVGIIVFFIGLSAATGGGLYYWWKKRSGFSPVGREEGAATSLPIVRVQRPVMI